MATPKGNATAYQALKPVAYTIGDMFMKDVDEWVKQGQYEKAAKAKAAAEKNARVDDWQKQFALKPQEVEKNITDATVKFMNYTQNEITNEMNKARAAETSYEQMAAYNRAQQLQQKFLTTTAIFGGNNLMKAAAELEAKAAAGAVFDGDPKKQMLLSLQQGSLRFEIEDNEPVLYFYSGDGDQTTDQKPLKASMGEVAKVMTAEGETNMLQRNKWNNNFSIDDRIKADAEKLYSKITKGDGNRTISEKKFDKEQAYKDFDAQYEFNAIPSRMEIGIKQFGYQTLGNRYIETPEDYKIVREAYIEKMKQAVPYEYSDVKEKTDEQYNLDLAKDRESIKASRRTGRGGGGNSAPKPPSITVTPNATITIQRSDGTVDYSNGTLLNLKNKEYIVAYKVPNSKGGGFHTEYFIVGKDEKGRMATEEPTSREDAFARIQGYGYDPLTFDKSVNRGTPVVRTNLRKGNKLGKIKYDGAYKQDGASKQGDSGDNELERIMNGVN